MPRAMEKAVVAMDKLAYGDRNRVADGLAGTVSDIRGASAWTKADGDCLVITDMDCEELALKVDLAGRIDVEEETGAAVGAGRGYRRTKEARMVRRGASRARERASRGLFGLVGDLD